LQLPMWLVHALKSGGVSLFTAGAKTLQLKVEKKRIDIDMLDKDFLKDILRVGAEGKGQFTLGNIAKIRGIAEELEKDGFTVTISHKGSIVITLGYGAMPTLSQVITGTNAIELNNLSQLIRLVA
jgi:hypothetical protein